MQWLVRGTSAVIAVIFSVFIALPARAIETTPSPTSPSPIDGSIMISAYSVQGDHLRYVQLYNDGDTPFDLTGWRVETTVNLTPLTLMTLEGLLAPGSHTVAADKQTVVSAQFTYEYSSTPSASLPSHIALRAPLDSQYLDEVVEPSIKSTTPSVPTSPLTYSFKRNISTSTGKYLTTFAAYLPSTDDVLYDDGLYVPPPETAIRIVEIYPNAPDCAPTATLATCSDYVKVQNPTDQPIELANYRLRSGALNDTPSSSTTRALSGSLAPGDYLPIPIGLTNSAKWVWLEDIYGNVMYDASVTPYPDSSSFKGQAWSLNSATDTWQWTRYPQPHAANQFTDGSPLNKCSTLRLNEIGANSTDQFIELYNPTSESLDLRGCQILTNRSETASYVFNDEMLAAGKFRLVKIHDTDLSLTKTTSGTVYLLSSDGQTEVDARSYENMAEETSLSLINGVWQQTFAITPGSPNVLQQYPACETGYVRNIESGRCNKIPASSSLTPCLSSQYRSAETNRCRNVISAASSLTPCDEGQYRNPVTNRCKSMSVAASSLTPCKAGQFRNPATNRCKSASSASSSLVPCAENQERNPATNRCRLKQAAIAADFPVETVADTAQATVGWWAFGGVGMLAAGYAGWEWRREALGLIRKAATFFMSGR